MSTLRLTMKLFRHNLRSTMSYLAALLLSVGIYYDFALLKYSPEALGGRSDSTVMVVCAAMMSVVMLVVFFAFVWTSSRFFLEQRKKEIGLYALCGVPMRRAARVFLYDGLLTGLFALAGGLAIGLLLTKLFLMGAARMIQLEAPMHFTMPVPALIETLAVVCAIFFLTSLRNARIVRKSSLLSLLQGMRQGEPPPKRRNVRAALAVLALGSGYAFSVFMRTEHIIVLCLPILFLVILGSYWAFEALLPAILERLTKNKSFFYRGMRMVGISNLWYRLRTNYRNLALTSILSATAITTLCTALTMSEFAGAREGGYGQLLFRAYSLTAWTDPAGKEAVEAQVDQAGIAESQCVWLPMTRLEHGEQVTMLIEQRDAEAAIAKLAAWVNLPEPDFSAQAGHALSLISPDRAVVMIDNPDTYDIVLDGKTLRASELNDAWLWGGNTRISEAYVVQNGFCKELSSENRQERYFLGVQSSDESSEKLLALIEANCPSASAEVNQSLTTTGRMVYGTLSYLGLILFVVFSLLTACALFFKQLSEASADRLKYQAIHHIGATRREMTRAVGVQIGLSLIVPLSLGFLHAVFAVRVMSEVFLLPTTQYLLLSLGIYACVVGLLFVVTQRRFMQIVMD